MTAATSALRTWHSPQCSLLSHLSFPWLCPEGPSSLLSSLALTGKHLSGKAYSLPGPKLKGISGTGLPAPAPPSALPNSVLFGAICTLHCRTGYLGEGQWTLFFLQNYCLSGRQGHVRLVISSIA